MRSIIFLSILMACCTATCASEPSSDRSVEERLLGIRLASYLNAYERTLSKRGEVELQIVQADDAMILERLRALHVRLSEHLKKLEEQARSIAAQLDKASARNSHVRAENLLQTMNTELDFPGRPLRHTGRILDIAIEGAGYFAVVDSERNAIAYTRIGNLDINASGHLVVGSRNVGLQLAPPIRIPSNATEVVISDSGGVSCRTPGNVDRQPVGQMRVAMFAQPKGLLQIRENLLAESEASGPAKLVTPGERDSGTLKQSYLEVSDSDRIRELIDVLIGCLKSADSAVTPVEQP